MEEWGSGIRQSGLLLVPLVFPRYNDVRAKDRGIPRDAILPNDHMYRKKVSKLSMSKKRVTSSAVCFTHFLPPLRQLQGLRKTVSSGERPVSCLLSVETWATIPTGGPVPLGYRPPPSPQRHVTYYRTTTVLARKDAYIQLPAVPCRHLDACPGPPCLKEADLPRPLLKNPPVRELDIEFPSCRWTVSSPTPSGGSVALAIHVSVCTHLHTGAPGSSGNHTDPVRYPPSSPLYLSLPPVTHDPSVPSLPPDTRPSQSLSTFLWETQVYPYVSSGRSSTPGPSFQLPTRPGSRYPVSSCTPSLSTL